MKPGLLTSCPDTRLGVSRVDPEQRTMLELIHVPFLGELVDTDADESTVFLISDENDDDCCLELHISLCERGQEVRQ